MAKLRARSGHGQRYDHRPAPRVVGACQEPNCPGELRVGTNAGETVIACHLCGVVWTKQQWPALALALQETEAP